MLVAGSTAYEDPERGAIIVRLTAGGPVDLTYGDYGVARTRLSDGGLPNDVAFQPDGAAVFGVPVRSETHQRFLVARVGNDGRPDLTFGTGGELQARVGDAQNATATSIALAEDGSIFVGGWASAGPGGQPYVSSRQFVAHIQRTGAVDPRFGLAGIAATVNVGTEPSAALGALVVQPDGRPVAVVYTADPVTTSTRGFIFRLQPGYAGGPVTGCGWNGWGQLGEAIGVLAKPAVGLRARTDVDGVVAGAYHSLPSIPTAGCGRGAGTPSASWATAPSPTGPPRSPSPASPAWSRCCPRLSHPGREGRWIGMGLGLERLRPAGRRDHPRAPPACAGHRGVGAQGLRRRFHSLALGGDGGVEAWGYNGLGQLGDGTTVNRHSPVPLENLAGAVAISTGLYHSLALGDDGTVRAWGWNKVRSARRRHNGGAAHPGTGGRDRRVPVGHRRRVPQRRRGPGRHCPGLGLGRPGSAVRWHHHRPPRAGARADSWPPAPSTTWPAET